jgi:hypothetical protein
MTSAAVDSDEGREVVVARGVRLSVGGSYPKKLEN